MIINEAMHIIPNNKQRLYPGIAGGPAGEINSTKNELKSSILPTSSIE